MAMKRNTAIAPTLAHVIGLETPKLEGRCIDQNAFGTAPCETPAP